jgi:signal transduction histidine kinase
VEQALELVDSLLETPREWRDSPVAAAATCLEQALEDLGAIGVEVTAALTAVLPLPSTSLRVILRNLLRNAVAGGAGHIHVAAVRSDGSWRLLVDDDGVGPTDVANYAAGSGLGLSLCARAARRYGGALELAARPSGGTRATLRLAEAS